MLGRPGKTMGELLCFIENYTRKATPWPGIPLPRVQGKTEKTHARCIGCALFLLIILVLTERKLETLIASLRARDLDIMKL